MPSLCFSPPAVQVCGPPPLESGSRLGGDAPTLPPGQRLFCFPWQCLALSIGMPYPTRASPHHSMPLPESRVFSCACMITHTWKLFTTRQKSCEPHLTFIISSHKLASVERSRKLLIVVCNERKRINLASRQ